MNIPAWYFWVGILASICIIVYMIPQLSKTIKTKNTESLSKAMLILSTIGAFLFVVSGIGILVNGILEGDVIEGLESGLPIMLANSVSCVISLILYIIKMTHRKKARKLGITEGELAKLMLAKKKTKKVAKTTKGK